MCYFITVGLDKNYTSFLHRYMQDEYGFLRSNNPSITDRLNTNSVAFHIVSTGKQPCSCGLFYLKREDSEPSEANRLRLKYRKKGWSAEKIERAISDKFSTHKRNFEGLKPDLRERLCGVVTEAGRVLLVVHWYSGDVDAEKLPIRSQKIVTCDELLGEDGAVTEDTEIEIVI
jgi:hypothetical protein